MPDEYDRSYWEQRVQNAFRNPRWHALVGAQQPVLLSGDTSGIPTTPAAPERTESGATDVQAPTSQDGASGPENAPTFVYDATTLPAHYQAALESYEAASEAFRRARDTYEDADFRMLATPEEGRAARTRYEDAASAYRAALDRLETLPWPPEEVTA